LAFIFQILVKSQLVSWSLTSFFSTNIAISETSEISVKICVLGSYALIVALVGVKFGMEEWTEGLHAKFHHWCDVSPLWGEKPQNRPLE